MEEDADIVDRLVRSRGEDLRGVAPSLAEVVGAGRLAALLEGMERRHGLFRCTTVKSGLLVIEFERGLEPAWVRRDADGRLGTLLIGRAARRPPWNGRRPWVTRLLLVRIGSMVVLLVGAMVARPLVGGNRG